MLIVNYTGKEDNLLLIDKILRKFATYYLTSITNKGLTFQDREGEYKVLIKKDPTSTDNLLNMRYKIMSILTNKDIK